MGAISCKRLLTEAWKTHCIIGAKSVLRQSLGLWLCLENVRSVMVLKISFLMIFLLLAPASFAESSIAKARFFGISSTINPTELNDELALQNIKDFKSLTKYGVDLTYQLNNRLDIGLRYERAGQRSFEIVPTVGQNYQATLIQEAIYGVARTTYLKTDIFRGDAFLGAGAANTNFKLQSATQDGRLMSSGYTSFAAKAGASIGIGLIEVFLFFEGGYDYNKVESGLEREGVIGDKLGTFDLSGSYFAVGLLFDGIEVHK
jgi:hypothetical protein